MFDCVNFHKQASEALQKAATPHAPLNVPRLGGTIEDDMALENALYSEAGESRASIEAKKSQAQAARSYLDHVMQDHSNTMSVLREEVKGCINHVNDLQMKHDELLRQLQRVEHDIALTTTRRAALQNRLLEEQQRYEERVSSLDSAQHEALKALRVEEGLRGLLAHVRDLEGRLNSVLATVQQPVPRPVEEYAARLDAASEALGAYAVSEATCISVLARRVALVDTRLQLLHREVEEYRALDMQVGLHVSVT